MADKYLLKIYVSGETPSSQLVISSLKNLIDKNYEDTYSLEVVKVSSYSELSGTDSFIAMSTLEKVLPPSIIASIRVLKDKEHVLIGVNSIPY